MALERRALAELLAIMGSVAVALGARGEMAGMVELLLGQELMRPAVELAVVAPAMMAVMAVMAAREL